MNAERLADVLARFADAVNTVVDDLRDDAGDGVQPAKVGREVEDNGIRENTVLEVNAGDLWRLVNRSRKMIRLAREGKIPDMEARAPLCRAIKALKQQGLVRKPHDLHD